MSIESFGISIGISVLELIVAFFLVLLSIHSGLVLFNKLTGNMDEWKEIKKGNTAVGILLSGVLLSIGLIVYNHITLTTYLISSSTSLSSLVFNILLGTFNTTIALLLGLLTIYLSVHAYDMLTGDVDEIREILDKNSGVALLLAVVMILISFVVLEPINSIVTKIDLILFNTLFA